MSDDTAYDIYSIFNHASSHMCVSEENHCTDVVCREGVIPIVFVPGVMGSNLINLSVDDEWLANSTWSLSGWLFSGAESRKNTLNPEQTELYRDGEIPGGIEKKYCDHNGKEIPVEDLLKARG